MQINLKDYDSEKLNKFDLIQNMIGDNIFEIQFTEKEFKYFIDLYEEASYGKYTLIELLELTKLADYLQYKNIENIYKILAGEIRGLSIENIINITGNKNIDEIKKKYNI